MKHIEALNRPIEGLAHKDMLTRAMGKFYTPDFITERLSAHLLTQIDFARYDTFSLSDPFCGDGRLIVSFLRKAMEKEGSKNIRWHVSIWDYDTKAISDATQNIEQAAASLGVDLELDSACRDSFMVLVGDYAQYDCVITNPPWDTLKPDSREMMGISADEKRTYRSALKEYDRKLAQVLPNSQPSRKYGGWGTNLSRSGMELALKLTKTGGLCGIVTPMTLLNDYVSSRLRQWMFNEADLYALDYYPAEAKLFGVVDQETISLCFRKRKVSKLDCLITAYSKSKKVVSQTHIEATIDTLQSIDYSLPVKNSDVALHLLDKWKGFQKLEDLEVNNKGDLWIGRELDETGYRDYLVNEGRYRFLKGRMISRYKITDYPTQFVSEELVRIPDSVSFFRVVWRDVSRRSQARRMQAAIIPPGIVTGNSLNVLHVNSGDVHKLHALVAIMNSIPFEFQVRSRLGTGHISASIVKKMYIPDLSNNPHLRCVSDAFEGINLKTPSDECTLELAVAKAYDLNRDEYKTLLDSFEGLSSEYKADLLAKW